MTVAEKIKTEEIPSDFDTTRIFQIVHNGIVRSRDYFKILKNLSDADDKEISQWLGINEKTYRNHKTVEAPTKISLFEHVVSLIALFKHGVVIFGNAEAFKVWLEKENFYFDRKAPIHFIGTIIGIKQIDDRLTGLEYGDNA